MCGTTTALSLTFHPNPQPNTMKVDHDLRQVIKAAHKHQIPLSARQMEDIKQKAVQKFLNENPAYKREVTTLMKRKAKHKVEFDALSEKLDKLLQPVGLDDDHAGTKISLRSWGRGDLAFVEAGGDLSGVNKNKWEVDEVIAELAAAEPKEAVTILAKYGINWK
jgi:hypothetical protein